MERLKAEMPVWILAIVSMALAFGGCTSVPAVANHTSSPDSKYRVYEMPNVIARPIRPTGEQNLAWIDDERILFEGLDRELRDPVATNDGVPLAMRALYVWNIRTQQVARYTKEALRSGLCFADGYVAYSVYRGEKVVWLEGPFGQEREAEPITHGMIPGQSQGRSLNPYTCRSYERASLPKPKIGGGIEPLRPEHGWIELAGATTWLRTKDGTLTQLAYEGRAIGTVTPQKYSTYAERYLYWRPWQATWLIEPSGMVHRLSSPDASSDARLEPAAQGKTLWRLNRINVRAEWDPGASGLYVYAANSKPERVITGFVDAMQVHRRGCLAAVIVDPWDREGRVHLMKAVDICQ